MKKKLHCSELIFEKYWQDSARGSFFIRIEKNPIRRKCIIWNIYILPTPIVKLIHGLLLRWLPYFWFFYNDKCKSSCGVTATMSNRLIMNSCPKFMQEYTHEHCNMCCSGGVSSLKILWHECGGIFSFQINVPEEPLVYDGTTTIIAPQSKIKFTPFVLLIKENIFCQLTLDMVNFQTLFRMKA